MAERKHLQNIYGKEAPTKTEWETLDTVCKPEHSPHDSVLSYFSLVSCGNVIRSREFWAQCKRQITG